MVTGYTDFRKDRRGQAVYGLRADGQWEALAAKDVEAEIWTRPMPSEHSCRLEDPSTFTKFRRQNRKVKNGKTIGFIFGQPKGGGAWKVQAMRYPTDDWDADAARKSCGKAGGKFEAASKSASAPEVKDAGVVMANRDGVLMPFLAGSWEEIEADLEDDAAGWLKDNGIDPAGKDLTLIGTYDGYGVVCLREWGYYSTGPRYTCYHGNWTMGDDGDPEWDGEPEQVSLVVTVGKPKPEPDAGQDRANVEPVETPAEMEAAAADFLSKSFEKRANRRIAKRHLIRLETSRDLLATVKGADELKAPTRAIAEKAHGLVEGVVKDLTPPPDAPAANTSGGPSGGPMEQNIGLAAAGYTADRLLAMLAKGGTVDYDTAGELIGRLQAERERQAEAALAELAI